MIYVVSGANAARYPHMMDQVYKLRHSVFVEELGWADLANAAGRETDQFDHPEAVHHICVRDGKVAGYQRMLPTTQPHLLTDVFPELCEGPSPRGHDTFELTRYCVAPSYREGRRGVSSVGSELMAGFVEWGLAEGIRKVIIEFETMWVLRALQLKFLVHPLGFETQIGKQKIVATQLGFSERTLAAIREYRGYSGEVTRCLGDIGDERLALAS